MTVRELLDALKQADPEDIEGVSFCTSIVTYPGFRISPLNMDAETVSDFSPSNSHVMISL